MFGPRKPSLNAKDTISRLVNTLTSASRIEDRRNALITLRGLGRDMPGDVATGAFDAVRACLLRGDGADGECARAMLALFSGMVKVDVYGELLVNDDKAMQALLEMLPQYPLPLISLLHELTAYRRLVRLLESSPCTSNLIGLLQAKDDVLFIQACEVLNGLLERSVNVQNRMMFEGGFDYLMAKVQEDDPALSQIALETIRWMLQGNYPVQKQVYSNCATLSNLLTRKDTPTKIKEAIDTVLFELSTCPCVSCIEALTSLSQSIALPVLLERHQECKDAFGKLMRREHPQSVVHWFMLEAVRHDYKRECIEAWLLDNYQGQLTLLSVFLHIRESDQEIRCVLEQELADFGKPRSNPKKAISALRILCALLDDNVEAKVYFLRVCEDEEESILSQLLLFLLSGDLEDVHRDDIITEILCILLVLACDHAKGEARIWEEGAPLLQFLLEVACMDHRHRPRPVIHAILLLFYLLSRTGKVDQQHQQRINFIRQRYHSFMLLDIMEAHCTLGCVKRDVKRFRGMLLEGRDERQEVERLMGNNKALLQALENLERENEALLIGDDSYYSSYIPTTAYIPNTETETYQVVSPTTTSTPINTPITSVPVNTHINTESNNNGATPTSTTNNKIITV